MPMAEVKKRCVLCGAELANNVRVLTCQSCRARQRKGELPRGVGREKTVKHICEVDFDDAYYIGGDEHHGGIYFAAAKRRGKWYMSTAYDIPHDCGDMTTDDGPYPTERAALEAGLDQGIQ